MSKAKSWASTLRLPKSTFPPRPLPQARDGYIQRCADELYRWQSVHRPADDEFVLHDGPPYANGDLHAGHALNKILKDMILRVKVQQGRRVSYVPGWDCHGLPIEMKAVGAEQGKHMSPGEVRKAARKLAYKTVDRQMKGFRSYAVMADWDARWTTMDKAYELRQLRLFQAMARRGLIYRRYKPVYWSPSSGTALAEAELEYNENHVSRAAYVRLRVVAGREDLPGLAGLEGDLYAVVWTTTPWTLPANRAVAVHDDLEYRIVRAGRDAYLVAAGCLDRVAAVVAGLDPTPEGTLGAVRGRQLTRLRYVNPLLGRSAEPLPLIHAGFVSAESGSGLVHCAPGHGFEDYLACLELGLPVAAPVDGDGRFTAEACPDDPDRLRGLPVLGAGAAAVLDLLGGDVMHAHDHRHKYPYDWRTKEPIIIRATAQWFADVSHIKEDAIAALEAVRFIPEAGRNRLESFVGSRSEWCISRQRVWGVPIPALYDPEGNAVMDDDVVDHIISVVEQRGIDAWWGDAPDDEAWVPPRLRSGPRLARGRDTMDVWFDSGTSWTMLGGRQADVYLEGSDQHRGWFQSSLLTRVAATADRGAPGVTATTTNTLGLAPFKTLITHGFTLDEAGKKMSKSLGNVVSPDEVMDGSLLPPLKPRKKSGGGGGGGGGGAAPPVLKTIHEALVKYRTTIRMLTGSMHAAARAAPLTALDQVALLQLRDAMAEVARHFDAYEFKKAFAEINRWVANDLSAFYLEALKDRLYCGDGGGALEPLFAGFLRMLAPLAPVLVEEAWDHRPEWLRREHDADPAAADRHHPLRQLYAAPLVDPARLTLPEERLRDALPAIQSAHTAIKAALERARADKVLGSSLQCVVRLEVPAGSRAHGTLEWLKDELPAMFVVSEVELATRSGGGQREEAEESKEHGWAYREEFEEGCRAWVLPPRQDKCSRCWRYVAPKEEELCSRCEEVVTRDAREGSAAA
ncbi:hypothetical protein VTJ83DRAFT_188 [Remersonia thermophila]|uniref:isoleucine--tRNA ligase n=1 Tax=Remersonia thermophila TaxID=72144 RepID=A0ABR4DKG8_9PEZI